MSQNGSVARRGTGRAYLIDRLERSGYKRLANRVKRREISARAAAIQVGFLRETVSCIGATPFHVLMKAWAKASKREREKFMREVTARES